MSPCRPIFQHLKFQIQIFESWCIPVLVSWLEFCCISRGINVGARFAPYMGRVWSIDVDYLGRNEMA